MEKKACVDKEKSESPVETESSQGQEKEFFYDPDRKDNLLERNETRLELWEGHLRDPIVALDKALKCLENSCQRVCWPENLVEGAIPHGRRWFPPKFVGEAELGGRLALLGSDG